MENVMAGLQLGQAVVDGMGRNGSAACATETAHHPSREGTSFCRAGPGSAVGVAHRQGTVDQQLIPKHPSHLNRLLHQAIAAVSAAHGSLVPLGQCISDSTGKGARWGLAHQSVIKHQQIGAAIEGDIPLKRPIRRVQIGQRGPAGAGGGTQRNGDAGQTEPMGQQLAGIEHFASACRNNRITS